VHPPDQALNFWSVTGSVPIRTSVALAAEWRFHIAPNARRLAVVKGASTGIGYELAVTCLMPGATETNFFKRADMIDTKIGAAEKDDPAER
jgi:hypothetical protein